MLVIFRECQTLTEYKQKLSSILKYNDLQDKLINKILTETDDNAKLSDVVASVDCVAYVNHLTLVQLTDTLENKKAIGLISTSAPDLDQADTHLYRVISRNDIALISNSLKGLEEDNIGLYLTDYQAYKPPADDDIIPYKEDMVTIN